MKKNRHWKQSLYLTALLVLIAGLSQPVKAASTGGSSGFSDQEIQQLRSQANAIFGTLPDKMPGSENDTEEKIRLGKELYFDTRLSENQTLSCNSCHRLDGNRAGVDGEPTSLGAFDERGERNAPTVLNAGFHIDQFWDGRADDLKEQAKGPVLNPVEMAMPNENLVIDRLEKVEAYQEMFGKAFPEAEDPINYDNMAEAIAAFERTLITEDRFDDFLTGDDQALSDREMKGLELFLQTGCTTCHNGPVFGGNAYQKVGLIHPYENKEDLGRYEVTEEESDKYKFKVPSLRNVALTGPYFHDGQVAELEEAVRKMAWMQLNTELSQEEVDQLVAFLNSLSDKERRRQQQTAGN